MEDIAELNLGLLEMVSGCKIIKRWASPEGNSVLVLTDKGAVFSVSTTVKDRIVAVGYVDVEIFHPVWVADYGIRYTNENREMVETYWANGSLTHVDSAKLSRRPSLSDDIFRALVTETAAERRMMKQTLVSLCVDENSRLLPRRTIRRNLTSYLLERRRGLSESPSATEATRRIYELMDSEDEDSAGDTELIEALRDFLGREDIARLG